MNWKMDMMNLSLEVEVQLDRKLVCKIAHDEKKQTQSVAPTFASSELLEDMGREKNIGTSTMLDKVIQIVGRLIA